MEHTDTILQLYHVWLQHPGPLRAHSVQSSAKKPKLPWLVRWHHNLLIAAIVFSRYRVFAFTEQNVSFSHSPFLTRCFSPLFWYGVSTPLLLRKGHKEISVLKELCPLFITIWISHLFPRPQVLHHNVEKTWSMVIDSPRGQQELWNSWKLTPCYNDTNLTHVFPFWRHSDPSTECWPPSIPQNSYRLPTALPSGLTCLFGQAPRYRYGQPMVASWGKMNTHSSITIYIIWQCSFL